MISSVRIQDKYNRLYKCLREYLWDWSSIECIADFETACYQAVPDLATIKSRFGSICSICGQLRRENEELDKELNAMASLLNDGDSVYKKIEVCREVVNHENQ